MDDRQLARFMAKVHKEQRGCWRWLGARMSLKQNGYGGFKMNGRSRTAHRVAYEHFVGPIPTGLQIDHLCRNQSCVNPEHLEAVSNRVNCQRGNVGQHNARKTHCPKGHPYSGHNLKLRRRPRKGWRERICRACNNRRSKPRRTVQILDDTQAFT